MNIFEQQYLDLLDAILTRGVRKSDRTGVGTTSLFGAQLRFDVGREFPLLTTKKLYTRAIMVELEWMLRGITNVQYLRDRKCTIWDEWADENGDLGPVYGAQWRKWQYSRKYSPEDDIRTGEWWIPAGPLPGSGTAFGEIDQIANALNLLKREPFSRRNCVTAWNPAENDKMALTPCHAFFQFNCRELSDDQREVLWYRQKLGIEREPSELRLTSEALDADGVPKIAVDLHMYQRSADVFLGVPFNIASYAMLLMIMTRCAGPKYAVGDFVHSFGDVHVYTNHEEQVLEQLSRTPKSAPVVELSLPSESMPWDFTHDMVTVREYDPHPALKAEVAV